MYWLNKAVWLFLNPVSACAGLGLAGAAAAAFGRGRVRRAGLLAAAAASVALWFAATPMWSCIVGLPLERPYLAMQNPDALPKADAIVLLGGGIGKCDEMEFPDMAESADRVWHAARLYRAGKAPLVVVSGRNDLAAAVPLLVDLGVPREAIAVDNESRNTYENSRFTERLVAERLGEGRTVLLVTSAWHMTRSLGNFAKTSLKAVPAPADFKAHNVRYGCDHWFEWLVPDADKLNFATAAEKEWLGRLARR